MSTHNIDFYGNLTKIIFQLSSNIMKYACYLFFCTSLRIYTGSALFAIPRADLDTFPFSMVNVCTNNISILDVR